MPEPDTHTHVHGTDVLQVCKQIVVLVVLIMSSVMLRLVMTVTQNQHLIHVVIHVYNIDIGHTWL